MNNNEDIMKEFNEMFGEKNNDSVEPYTTNQNNNIKYNVQDNNSSNNYEEVQNNVNYDNNQNNNINSYVNNNVTTNDGTFINNNENISPQLVDTTSYISSEPVKKKKSTKKNTVQINSELKTAILIAIVLLGAMAVIPSLFDWIDNLKLIIFG